jgi:hypothetical protein
MSRSTIQEKKIPQGSLWQRSCDSWIYQGSLWQRSGDSWIYQGSLWQRSCDSWIYQGSLWQRSCDSWIYHLSTKTTWLDSCSWRVVLHTILKCLLICLMVFNATFNNISLLIVEETGRPKENHRPVTDKLYHIMLYTSPWSRFQLTTSVMVGRLHTIQSRPWWPLNLELTVTMTMVQYMLLATDKINKKLRQSITF